METAGTVPGPSRDSMSPAAPAVLQGVHPAVADSGLMGTEESMAHPEQSADHEFPVEVVELVRAVAGNEMVT